MDKSKLRESKITGNSTGATDNANPEFSVVVYVRAANYEPDYIALRKRITGYIFTANVTKKELDKLEADEQITSVSINERLDSV
jgi:hypothetical protein